MLRLLTLTERDTSLRKFDPMPRRYSHWGIIIVAFPKDIRCFFCVWFVSNFKHCLVSSFSRKSPRSQELLVSDLWFIYLNFGANDFIFVCFFYPFISPHFTQIEDRKSAGAFFVFCWAIFLCFHQTKVGAVWQPGIVLAFQIQVLSRMGWLPLFFSDEVLIDGNQKSGFPKTTEAHRMLF